MLVVTQPCGPSHGTCLLTGRKPPPSSWLESPHSGAAQLWQRKNFLRYSRNFNTWRLLLRLLVPQHLSSHTAWPRGQSQPGHSAWNPLKLITVVLTVWPEEGNIVLVPQQVNAWMAAPGVCAICWRYDHCAWHRWECSRTSPEWNTAAADCIPVLTPLSDLYEMLLSWQEFHGKSCSRSRGWATALPRLRIPSSQLGLLPHRYPLTLNPQLRRQTEEESRDSQEELPTRWFFTQPPPPYSGQERELVTTVAATKSWCPIDYFCLHGVKHTQETSWSPQRRPGGRSEAGLFGKNEKELQKRLCFF